MWGVLSAQVEPGKQGNRWDTGGHTPPTVAHLENIWMSKGEARIGWENVETEIYAD